MLRCTCDARPASTAICIMLVSNGVCSSCCCPTSAGKVVLEKWIIILFSVFLLCQSQSVELGRKGVREEVRQTVCHEVHVLYYSAVQQVKQESQLKTEM